jgi:CRISPR-associated protein Cst1
MEKEEKYMELYPAHWLYNAGVVGFLKVLNECNINIQLLLQKDGRVKGNITSVFNETIPHNGFNIPLIVWKWLMKSGNTLKKDFNEKSQDPVMDIWGTIFNVVYRGFYNANSNLLYTPSKSSPAILTSFLDYTKTFLNYDDHSPTCSFCLKKGTQFYKNRFSSEHYKELGGSDGTNGMPNSFWNNNKITGTSICDTCSFLLLCRHLSFVELMDRTKIFINAPSFQIMYELNKVLSNLADKENASYRNLLAMSVIEFSVKTNVMLHAWTSMDIEIVAIGRNGVVEFINLPYETIKLLSNKRIGELLSSIGEFSVLNLVIENKWKEIVELGYRILKISMKSDDNKADQNFIRDYLFLSKNKHNKTTQRLTANKILKLYALIDERTKTK